MAAPHPHVSPSARARRRSFWWTAILLALLTPLAWLINLPYFAASAGPTDDAVDAVIVEENLAVFEPEGELILLTVSLQPVNLYEAAIAFFDQRIDLIERELLRPAGETDEEARQRNLRAMDRSKDIAIAVALSELGLEERPRRRGGGGGHLPGGRRLPTRWPMETCWWRWSRNRSGPWRTSAGYWRTAGPATRCRWRLSGTPSGQSSPLRSMRTPMRRTGPWWGITASTSYPIEIDSANYGGPSAGMIYTLAIMDLLEQGELTDGRVVAGTGTISMDGTVGAIGGIRQKLVAAEAAGADVVLVPRDNYDEASDAPVDVEIVAVESISDAVSYLREGKSGIIEEQ